MIKEAYVSFEVAKLLKEKGFDMFNTYGWDEQLFDKEHPRNFSLGFDNKEHWISCPTHQMATKWLREVHDIFIKFEFVTASGITEWHPSLNLITENKYIHANKLHWYPSYEEAVEAALKYILEKMF